MCVREEAKACWNALRLVEWLCRAHAKSTRPCYPAFNPLLFPTVDDKSSPFFSLHISF